jgi:hypothetical protein
MSCQLGTYSRNYGVVMQGSYYWNRGAIKANKSNFEIKINLKLKSLAGSFALAFLSRIDGGFGCFLFIVR